LIQHTGGSFYGDAVWGAAIISAHSTHSVPDCIPLSGSFPPRQVGKTIGILGQGFTGNAAVSFNGKATTFHVTSETFLTAVVPSGATSGLVTVATPSTVLKSSQVFIVIP
jgi:hypothetical protein